MGRTLRIGVILALLAVWVIAAEKPQRAIERPRGERGGQLAQMETKTARLGETDDAGTAAGAIPSNDSCADADSVVDNSVWTFDSTGATTDGPLEPGCGFSDDQVHEDVWFDYVAGCTGTAVLETCGSTFDTRMVVYSGCGCPPTAGSRLECNDDSCGSQSSVNLSVTAGQCYKIRVGGPAPGPLPSSGIGQLSVAVVCDCLTAGDCDDGFQCTLDSCNPAGCDNHDTNTDTCPSTPDCAGYSDCNLSSRNCVCHEGWIPDQLEPGTVHAPPAAPDACAPGTSAALGDTSTHEVGHWLGLYHTRSASASVYLHSGEFYHTAVDLVIPGRGLDLVWARKYRSKVGPNTAAGNGWDFSYNIRVEPFGDDLMLHDGNSRRDVYTLQSNGTWTHDEFFRVMSSDLSGFTVSFTDQSVWRLHPLDGSPQQGRLSEISDRFGNTMTYEYDTIGRLTRIRDTLDTATNPRDVVIGYNTDGLIQSVTDWTGRQVQYEYYQDSDTGGSAGDLKSVTTPAVTGTPTGNDYPAGKTTLYTYSEGHADERLNHNLLTITDPKGQTPVRNTYASTTNPADSEFDRVIQQAVGDPTELTGITARPFSPGAGDPPAVIKVTMNDRVGNVSEHFFDAQNRCVMVREYTGRADPDQPTDITAGQNLPVSPVRASDPAFFETRYEWNANSLPTRFVLPEVDDEVLVYDSASLDPRKRADLLQVCHNPGPRGGDQSLICELFEYDTGFGGCAGSNFVVRHTDPRGNETQYSYDALGNLTHAQHRIPTIVEDLEYNAFGQLTAYVHPDNGSGHRRRDELRYYQPTDGCMSGYLKDLELDAPGLGLTTTYEYDCLGRLTRSIDPRGNDSLYEYNQLDQVVRTQSEEVPAAGGGTVRYERLHYYDRNDNVVRICVDNKDEQGVLDPGNAYLTTLYEYDVLNYMTRMCAEHGSHDVPQSPPKLDCDGLPDSEFLRTEYAYDSNNNLTLARSGEATNGNDPDNTMHRLYDERDLVFKGIRAQGTSIQSTDQYDYDANGVITLFGQGLEATPNTTTYAYDGFNRLTLKGDSFGNRETYHYDPNSNMLTLRVDGESPDVAGDAGNIRLFETTYEYDSMDRITRSVAEHFDTATQAPVGDGQSTSRFVYSDTSQVLQAIDDRSNTATYAYDSMNRLTRITDPKSNQTEYTYDPNSNVITLARTDLPDLGGSPQLFETEYVYDPLNRLTRQIDNVGSATDTRYDSRGNRVQIIDPLGTETRYTYDGLNRLTSSAHDMDTDGASDTDPADIVLRYSYDDASRLVSRTDDNQHTTTYAYDSLDRLTLRTYADSTDEAYEYDARGNLTRMTDPNASTSTYEYDAMNRLTLTGVTFGPGVAEDTTFERFAYDGLSRIVQAEDDDSTVVRAYDSLHNCVRETLNGVASTRTYDGVGNRLTTVYPGGLTVQYDYDALNRLTRITDPASAQTHEQSHYVGPYRFERRDLGNGTQARYEYDGITGVPNPPGDFGVGQIIRTQHLDPGLSTLDERTYAWDPLHNKLRRSDVRSSGPALTHEYAYDPIYRLTRVDVSDRAGPVGSTQYDLDGVGNRLTVTGGPDAGTYLLDPTLPEPADFQMNQYTATPTGTRSHDANGNVTGKDSAVCELVPPGPVLPDPSGLQKNRAFSFASDSSTGEEPFAYRVRIKRMYIDRDEDPDNGCPVRTTQPDLSQFEEEIRWLGAPAEYLHTPLGFSPKFIASKLECCPLFRDWSETALADEFGPDADPTLLFAYGEEVVPCSIYEVQRVSEDCPDLSDESCYSVPALEVQTGKWGDVSPVFGQIDFIDIGRVVQCFKYLPLATGQTKPLCVLKGNSVDYSLSVSFIDIGLAVTGFKTLPYAEDGPVPGVCSAGCPPAGGAGDCISYDFRNRIVEFNDQDTGMVHRYRYDAFGRRIAKIADAFGSPRETHYYYDGGRVLEEQDGTGATQAQIITGLGCGGHVVWISAGQRYYYHCDDLGNPVAMTDASGNLVERYDYGDYGAPAITDGSGTTLSQSSIGNPYLFGGRRYDPETGLYLHGSRYLDPGAGRYATRNGSNYGVWAEAQGNAYSYAGNNPWSVADVEGYPDIAGLFKDTAEGETGHAHGHLDYLKQVGDPATAAIAIPNLIEARKSGNESAGLLLLQYQASTAAHNPRLIDDVIANGTKQNYHASQYRETDYNFVSRLMEEVGIYYSMPLLPPMLDDRRWRALQSSRATVRGWDPRDKQPVLGGIRRVRGGVTGNGGGTYFKVTQDGVLKFRNASAAGALKTIASSQTDFHGKVFPKVEIHLFAGGGPQAAAVGALKTLGSAQTLFHASGNEPAAIGSLKTVASAQAMFRGDVTLKRGVFGHGDITLKRGVFKYGDLTLKRGIRTPGAPLNGPKYIKSKGDMW